MEITKAYLEDRAKQMKAQREQLIANLNMLQGIINEDETMLARLDAPEPLPAAPVAANDAEPAKVAE